MENLKIRVMTEQESKEAQELFFELGAEWKYRGIGKNFHFDESNGFLYCDGCCITTGDKDTGLRYFNNLKTHMEVTLPQLRDKVVLHRNDVRDANHTDQDDWKWFIASDGKAYVFAAGNAANKQRWDLADLDHVDLTLIKKDKGTENLISGEEALSKVHTGAVQYVCLTNPVKNQWVTITDHFWDQYHLGVFLNKDTTWRFRLKPRTIKIGDIEVPAPFEPKEGDWFWSPHANKGSCYIGANFQFNNYGLAAFGAWRTESEIKQVVAALRKLMGVAK